MGFKVAEELAQMDEEKARKIERLDQLRRIKDLTKKEFAERLGVHPKLYLHWTSGRRKPNEDHLKKINYYLENFEYDEVITDVEGENPVVYWITDIEISLEAWSELQKYDTKDLRDLLGKTLEKLAENSEGEESSMPEIEINGEMVRGQDD